MNRLVLSLATLGPIGTRLPAPGTMGSLAGVSLFVFLVIGLKISPIFVALIFVPLFLIGIPICSRAEILLDRNDPGEVIWDEFCVIPFVYLPLLELWNQPFAQEIWLWLALGFILFRLLDITKPSIIRSVQSLPGGLGVMIDDLLAALSAGLLLYAMRTFSLSFLN